MHIVFDTIPYGYVSVGKDYPMFVITVRTTNLALWTRKYMTLPIHNLEKSHKHWVYRTYQYLYYLRNSQLANSLSQHSSNTGFQYLCNFHSVLYIMRILLSYPNTHYHTLFFTFLLESLALTYYNKHKEKQPPTKWLASHGN